MKRLAILLMTVGALALAGCSGGEEGADNAAANMAADNFGVDAVTNEMNDSSNAAARAPDATAAPAASAAKDEPAATKIAPVPPRAVPRPAPKADAPKAPRAEPAQPPKEECLPEHKAAGHC